MAFATLTFGTAYTNNSLATSHTIPLPTSPAAGERLYVVLTMRQASGTTASTFPSGFTKVLSDVANFDSTNNLVFAYKDLVGGDAEIGASTISVSVSPTARVAGVAWKSTGHAATAPEAPTFNNTSSGTNPNPPSCDPSGWGTEDTTWVAIFGGTATSAINTFPTNYSSNNISGISTGGTAGTRTAFGLGTRNLNAASDDPGTFGTSTSGLYTAATIAIRSGAASQNVTPGIVANSSTVYAPNVQTKASPGIVAAPSTVFAPANVYSKTISVKWKDSGDSTRFTEWLLSDSGAGATTALTNVDTAARVGVWEGTAGSQVASESGERAYYMLNGASPWDSGHILAYLGPQSFLGATQDGTISPQHGLILRGQQSGGRNVGIIAWQNIFAGFYWTLNIGVWGSATDGSDFLNRQTNLGLDALIKNTSITAYVRASNVVTVTAAGHNCEVGDYVMIDMATGTLDTGAIVTAVNGNDVVYTHAGADNAAGGTGTLRRVLPYWLEMKMASDSPTESIVMCRAWRKEQARPAWVVFDDDAGLVFPGGNGNYVSTPDASSYDITGDFDLRVDLTATDWTPTTDQVLVGKYVTTGNNRSYAVRIKPAGTIELLWAATGAVANGAVSTVAPTVSNGQRLAIRVEHDNDNGVGSQASTKFYTAPTIDGPWTQLGTTVTTNWASGAGGIFNGTGTFEVGGFNTGTSTFIGTIHNWQLRDASSTIVSEYFGHRILNGATSFNDNNAVGGAFTINGTVSQVNTCLVGGSSAQAMAVDVSKAGREADRVDTPTPTGPGTVGVTVAHLGTSDLSRATYGPIIAHMSSTSEFVQPPLVAAPSTVFAPTVAQGSQAVTPGIVAAPSTVFAPQVNMTVVPPLVAAPSTVFAPQVNMTVVAPMVAAPSTTFAPTVHESIAVPLVAAPSTVFAPKVNMTVAAPLVAAPSTVFAPNVATAVSPGVVAAPSTVFAPQVNLRISMPLVVAPSTVHAPGGSATIAPSIVAAPATVYAPQVNLRFTAPFVATPSTVFAPQVNLAVATPLVAAPAAVFAPQVNQRLTLPLVATASTVFAPQVNRTVVAPLVAAPATLFAPKLNLRLLMPLVTAPSAVYTPFLPGDADTTPGIPVDFPVQDNSVVFTSPSGTATVVESSRAFVRTEVSATLSVTESKPSATFSQADGKVEVSSPTTQWEIEET